MIGSSAAAFPKRHGMAGGWGLLCFGVLGLLAGLTMQSASAADCPGHPDAIGTSRTLVVDPREHPLIGTMQYAETLPLEDHEVVLTFDDGPLPRNSNQILDILASQCVKATFFEIGQMARSYPEGVRKLRDAGHTIGTHSQTHPLTMNRMPIEQAKQQIDDGIASVKAALGDDSALAPFFRIPGLMRAEAVEDYLISQGIQTWSADFPADDWRHISSSRVYDLAIQRIEAKGKGILLLHDIQARTVAALPRILHELKARGFRIVHVVPATPDRPATPTEPQQWQMHPTSEVVAISHWPKIPNFVFAGAGALPAPSMSDLDGPNQPLLSFAEPFEHGRHARGIPWFQASRWPQPSLPVSENIATSLVVPAKSIFEIQENPRARMQTLAIFSHRAEQTASADGAMEVVAKPVASEAGSVRRMRHGKIRNARQIRTRPSAHAKGHPARLAGHARKNPLKRVVRVKKRNV
jgi:peptidoglycan/xylan/chitin deacetylase (PgdA/CDA1 family)